MASSARVTVEVQVEVPQDVKRLRALELAVEARQSVTDAAAVVADAEAYLRFLNGKA